MAELNLEAERAAMLLALEATGSHYLKSERELMLVAWLAARRAVPAQAKVVAWMTEDGRVASDETKRTAMAKQSAVNFNIPLCRADVPAQASETGTDALRIAIEKRIAECEVKVAAVAPDWDEEAAGFDWLARELRAIASHPSAQASAPAAVPRWTSFEIAEACRKVGLGVLECNSLIATLKGQQ